MPAQTSNHFVSHDPSVQPGGASIWIQLVSCEALYLNQLSHHPPLCGWRVQWKLDLTPALDSVRVWNICCCFDQICSFFFTFLFGDFFHLHHRWIMTSLALLLLRLVLTNVILHLVVRLAAAFRKLKTQRDFVWRRCFLDWSWWTDGYDDWLSLSCRKPEEETHTREY